MSCGSLDGKGVVGRMDICIYMAECHQGSSLAEWFATVIKTYKICTGVNMTC